VLGAGDALTAASAHAPTTAARTTIRAMPASPRRSAGDRPIASVASGVSRKASSDTANAATIPSSATSTPAMTVARSARRQAQMPTSTP